MSLFAQQLLDTFKDVVFAVSTPVKYVLGFLLLINLRSLPLIWHYRVLNPIFAFKVKELLFWLKIKSTRVELRKDASQAYWDARSPIGDKPFEAVMNFKLFNSIDDSDFNMHLSNSSYAKALDPLRFDWGIKNIPQILRQDVGGTLALAGTSFLFIREIPMLSPYEVRIYIGGWGEKWFYAYGKFVSKGKKRPPHQSNAPIATVSAPTPMTDVAPSDLSALAAKLAKEEEPDGAIVHCVSVSILCFKIGRVTVPPALILTLNGFTAKDGHNRENPPKAYLKMREMGGDVRKFLTGGWRQEDEKWWDEELRDPANDVRQKNFEGIRLGMENARAY